MNDKQVLVVGNPVVTNDSKPAKLVKRIQNKFPQFSFVSWDPTEELPINSTDTLLIIDTVQGIQTVTLFKGLDAFSLSPRNSVHDFDLPVALSLLQKIGRVKEITIIGIPQNIEIGRGKKELQLILESI